MFFRARTSRLLLVVSLALAFAQFRAGGPSRAAVVQSASPSLRAAIDAARYAAHPAGDSAGGYYANNPAQRYRAQFTGAGLVVASKPAGSGDEPWRAGLSLSAVARGEQRLPVGAGDVTASGTRVAVAHTVGGIALEEWYLNRRTGLEHGISVAERPLGGHDALRLQFALSGTLVAHETGASDAVLLSDASGHSLMYDQLHVTDRDGRTLASRFDVTAGSVAIVIDDAGAAYPIVVDPTITQQAVLTASNADANDHFGLTIGISGDTAVVATINEDSNATGINGNQADNSAVDAGAAYVFVRDANGNWTQQAYLKASNTGANDQFGCAASISGDTIVIGAEAEDSNATGVNGLQTNNSAAQAGAAYVFVRSNGVWTQQAYLKASNTAGGDHFGASASISADTIVVGATGEDSAATTVNGNQADNTANGAGAAYVFVRTGSVWAQQAYLKPSNGEGGAGVYGDVFGISVGVSGNSIIVGAAGQFPGGGEDSAATGVNGNQADNSATDSGAAYIFVRSGTTWTQQAYLKASNTGADDRFGRFVAIDQNTAVVGAMNEDSAATGVGGNQADESAANSGAAYVFFRTGTTWVQQAYLKAATVVSNALFGASVAVSGDTVAVGANQNAYAFQRTGSTWSALPPLGVGGSSVAISSDTIAVGSTNENTAAGAAHMFLVVPNRAPVADAGLDVFAAATSASGAPVTLSGASSSDPDGDVLTYQWKNDAFVVVGNAASLSTSAGFGAHTLTLTVTDPSGLSATDTVVVTVADSFTISINTPPLTGATYLRNQVVLADFTCSDSANLMTSCSSNGATLDTATSGTKTFTVTTTNSRGDTSSQSRNYQVLLQAAQSIAFPAPAAPTYGGTTLLNATATSGLAVTYTSNTPSVCSVTGATVTALAVGSCSITATQGGDVNWLAAAPATQSFAVLTRPVTATLTANSKVYDGTTAEPSASLYCAVAGVLIADSGSVTCAASNGTFDSSSAGTRTVTATVTIDGAAAGNYTLGAAGTTVQSRMGQTAISASIATSTTAAMVYGQGATGTAFTTVASGTCATCLASPRSTAVDGNGNVYVADTGNDRVLFYLAGGVTATRVYGQPDFTTGTDNTGDVSANSLSAPTGVLVDVSGNLYVADTPNNRVLFFPAGQTTATRVYGQNGSFTTSLRNNTNGVANSTSASSLNNPHYLAIDGGGNLYVSDEGNSRVLFYPADPETRIPSTTATRVYGQNGNFATSSSNNTGGTAGIVSATSLGDPRGIALDGGGNLYVADFSNNRILFYAAGSTTATRVYGQQDFVTGTAPTSASATNLDGPYSLTMDAFGNLYVADFLFNRVLFYLADATTHIPSTTATTVYGQGGVFTTGAPNKGGASAVALHQPRGVTIDSNGNLYVTDATNNRMLEYSATEPAVVQAPLVVTASSGTKAYGATFAVTPSYGGFVNGETNAALTAQPVCTSAGAASGAAPGTYATTCSGATADNYSISYGAGTLTVSTIPATPTLIAQDKTYDRTNTEPNTSMSCTLTGVLPADSGNVTCTATAGTFDGANAGSHTVTATATIGGSAAANYTFGTAGSAVPSTTATASATINILGIGVDITADNRTYDGTTSATIHPVVVGVIAPDVVTVSATGTFDTKNVGTAKLVTSSHPVLGGADASNYGVTIAFATATANITTAPVTATLTAAGKTYDGTTAEPNASMSCLLTGVVAGDASNVTCTASGGSFDSANAGSRTVTATVTMAGSDAGNYTLGAAGTSVPSSTATAAATITKANQSISLSSATSDGTPDTAFSTAIGTGFNGRTTGTAVQSDGKIIVGGLFTTFNGVAANFIARLNADGTRDTSFNIGGAGFDGAVYSVAVQPDGKIVVGGQFNTVNGVASKNIVRLNADGTPDTAFSTNIGTGLDQAVMVVAVQPDGKILAGGFFFKQNGVFSKEIARFNANGTPDVAFRTNLAIAFDGDDVCRIALQPDGKIVVIGSFYALNLQSVHGVARINADGTPDVTFNANTGAGLGGGGQNLAVALQADGKILLGGTFSRLNNVLVNGIGRLNADGTPDLTFTALGGATLNAVALAVQPDGKIVSGTNANSRWLVRLNPDGSKDTAFETNLGTGLNNAPELIVLQPDGAILMVDSFTTLNGQTANRIARLKSSSWTSAKTYGDAPFTALATSSSGLAVTFASTTPGVCTVSGSTVTIVATGTCAIAIDQSGNGNYNAAPQVVQNITVSKASQAITFNALTGKTYGDAPFAVSATSTSGLTVSFASTTPAVCALSGTTVTIATTGTCTITADQAGDGNYSAATQASRSFTVGTAALTATLTAAGKVYDGTAAEPDASMSCTLAGVLPADAGNVSCAPTSGTFNLATVGSRTVTATVTISGSAASNYTLGAAGTTTTSASKTATASITAQAVTATIAAANKTYDGTATEPTANVACTVSGVVSADSANTVCVVSSATFSSALVGSRTVTAAVVLSGTAAGNYTLVSASPTATATITTKAVTTAVTAANKAYDATATEPNANMTCTLSGVVAADSANVLCTANNGVFDGANVGAHSLTATVTLSGAASGNYTLGAAGTSVTSATAGGAAGTPDSTADFVWGQNGNFTTNAAGLSATSLNIPFGVATDTSGNVYVADSQNHRVLYYPAGSSTATRVYGQNGSFTANTANNGGISANSLSFPRDLTVDSAGGLYVSDTGNHRVLYFAAGSTTATRVYGQGGLFTTGTLNTGGISANSVRSSGPLAVDAGNNLYLSDVGNHRVLYYPSGSTTATRVYGQSGSFTVGTANNGGVTADSLNLPAGVALDAAGNLYVADRGNNRVLFYPVGNTTATRVYGQNGGFTSAIVNNTNGTADVVSASSLRGPAGIAVDSGGNLYVVDWTNYRMLFYPAGGTTATAVYGQSGSIVTRIPNNGGVTANSLSTDAFGMTYDSNGNVYVADASNNRILRFNAGAAGLTANITTAPVTATLSAAGKTYDGTTTAPNASMNCTLSGVAAADAGNVTCTATSGTFNLATAGSRTVTATVTISGSAAANYTLGAAGSATTSTSKTATASITGQAVTATITASSKTYNGNANATITSCTLTGVVNGDTTGCVASAIAANNQFASASVGIGKTVTATGITLTNNAAGNYTLSSSTATTTANITTAAVTATLTAGGKTYDRTTAEPDASMSCALAGVLGGDTANVSCTATGGTFNLATAGSRTVTAIVTISGTAAGNYTMGAAGTATSSTSTTASSTISAKSLTASITADNKTYDGTPAATIHPALAGVIAPDVVTVSGTGTFATKITGLAKTVTSSNLAIAGADAPNYTLGSATATTTADITKANATIAVTGYTVTFDGNAHTATGTAAGVESETLSALLHLGGTTHTNAGDYPEDVWTFDGDANYNSTTGFASDSIAKAASTTVVTCAADATYTGAVLEICSVAVTGAGGLTDTATVTYTNNTNVGTATASATYAGDVNHEGSTASATFAITKAGSTTAVSCTPSVTYTGAAQEVCTATATGVGSLSAPVDVTYTSNTNVGTATATATFAGDANHDGSTASSTFAIAKATSTTAVSCTPTVTYTGAAQEVCTATATGVGSLSAPVDVTYTSNTNVGTAIATAAFAGDANHDGSTASSTFAIAKAGSTTAVSCTPSVTYTGAAQEVCAATATGVGGLNEPATVTYTSNTNVGTAIATAAFAGDANHDGSTASSTFAIAKATSTTAVSCTPTLTYTGAAQEVCAATATGVGSLSAPVEVTYTSNTNVGTATATATFAGDANHDGSTASATFAIAKATSTTAVSCTPTVTYTGAAQEICTATATGVGSLSEPVDVTYTSNTNVGTATATATFAGDANHDGSTASATFAITKATSTTAVSCTPSVTYTGAAIEVCTATATGVGGLNQATTVTYTNNTVVGTATGTATFAGDANHDGSTASGTFAITKATSTTAVSCTPSVTYTGAAQEVCTATATGVGSMSAPVTVTYTNNTAVGTATGTATFAGDSNHDGSTASATFAITKAGSTTAVSCTPTATYTGAAIEVCAATATGVGGLNEATTVTYTSNINVGTATASATFAGDANHDGSTASATFAITKATSATAVSCTPSVTYTGAAQEVCTATATATGVGGLNQATTVTYTNNIGVGTATGTATFAGDANHDGSTASSTFAITKAGSTTAVSCTPTVTYTGAAIEVCTATATGVGGLNQATTVTYTNNTVVGTATGTATFAGDANHDGSTASSTFAIAKATSSTAVSCTPTVTYTGAAIDVCTATATGVGSLSAPVDVTYTSNTNVGTATASATFAGDANHDGSTASATFAITKATSTTAVSCTPTVTYTGTAQEVCTATATGAGGLNQATAVTYTNNIAVGTATGTATFAGDANHDGSTASATFAITKAGSTTAVSCAPTVTYTGAAIDACTATVTGVGGLNEATTVAYTNNTIVGTATGTATFAGDANHDGSTASSTFAIAKASSTTAVSCTPSVTFTGAAQEVCTATVTGVGSLSEPVPVSYTNNTAVGTATGTATFAGDANHDGSTASATFAITKATSTTAVSCTPTVTYTGAAQEVCTATVTGVGSLSAPVAVTYSSNTAAGTATGTATFGGDANHDGSTASATFAITKAALTVTANDKTRAALAPNPVFDGTLTGVLGADAITATYAASAATLPGTYPIVPTLIDPNGRLDNYTVTSVNGTLTVVDADPPVVVVPASLTVEATSASGAAVDYAAQVSAIDAVFGPVSVNCAPASGSTFAIGDTTVHCTASDGAGNVGGSSIVVTVRDTTTPTLATVDITAVASDPAGIAVNYAPVGHDLVSGDVASVCSPTSGTMFSIGEHAVSCTATDAAGNVSAIATFTVRVLDGVAPTVTVPATITSEATAAGGATVAFTASAIDNVDVTLTTSCAPLSGSTFPIGDTIVTCSATDAANNSGTATFTVTVRDTVAPTLALPVVAPVVSLTPTIVVNYVATAADVVDGAVAITCTPASGSSFPVGSTLVACTATDAHGNTATGSFTVKVNDGVAPVVTVSPAGNRTVEATSSAGAIVTYAAAATDNYDSGLPVTCAPVSGSVFPIGPATLVTCSATDSAGNTGTATFTVTVVDTTAPVITVPAPITQAATAAAGVAVNYTASAVDIVSGNVPVTCAPASGTTFPVGTTTVHCTASDSRGNASAAGFAVTVTLAQSGIEKFVAFSRDSTRLLSKATVVSGDIGANERRVLAHGHKKEGDDGDRDDITVSMGQNTEMTQSGSRVVGDTVSLLSKSSVFNIVDNYLINKTGTIRGAVTTPLAIPYLAMPAFPTVAPGTTAITVAKKTTVTLAAGAYGAIKVENGGTLIMTGGLYQVASIDVDQQGTILFRGASTVRVKTEFETGAKAKVILDQSVSGLRASQIVFYVLGLDSNCAHSDKDDDGDDNGPASVHIGQQNVVQANIYAANGTVWIKSKTQATGAFIGMHVRIGQNVTLTLDSAFR